MRLLLVADLHYTLRQLDWVASVAPDFDLVVIAGDVLDVSAAVPVDVQIVAVSAFLERLAETSRVVVCSGNHDLDGRDGNGEKAAGWVRQLGQRSSVVVDGSTIEVDGVLVTVCPWWDGPAGKEAVVAQLAADAARKMRPWVWVYHWPPDGSPVTWTGQRFYGDADLRSWITEHSPDMVLTGHVHEPPFKREGSWADRIGETWVFNAGRQIGPDPCHVIVDTEARSASWWSLAGDEHVSLDGEPPSLPRAV
jgi:Icc-related predicted phosphoesterase